MARERQSPWTKLKHDLVHVGRKTGFGVLFLTPIYMKNPVPDAETAMTILVLSEAYGAANYILGRPSKYEYDGERRELDLRKIVESILVGTNPALIVYLLNSDIGTGNAFLAGVGLLLVNVVLLYAAARLGEMEKHGGGRDLGG